MAKIDAVVVIEMSEGVVQGASAYTDDPEGNAQAEKRFRAIVKENYPETSDHDLEVMVEDRICEKNTWQAMIVHG